MIRLPQPGIDSPAVLLENDNTPEANMVKQGNLSMQTGEFATAYSYYMGYLNAYKRGNYAPLAAIGVANALLAQNNPNELLNQNAFLRTFIRNKSQAYVFDTLVADAYARTGARLEAVNMLYSALGMATAPDEVTAAENRLGMVLGALSQNEIEAVLTGQALRNLPANDLYFRIGQAAIINAGNYALGAQILRTFMQRFPYDRNIPRAEALLSSGTTTQATGRAVIGCLLPISGKYERFGKRTMRGVELAMTRFQGLNPGARVQLIIKDTGGTREQTISAIRELANEGAAAIVGPFEEVDVAAQTAQAMGIPIIIINQKDDVERYGDFVFKNFISPQDQVSALVNYAMKGLGISSFGILYPLENFGRRYLDIFINTVENNGGEVTAVVPYDTETKADFGPEINNLATQGQFHALFFPEGASKTALIAPQLFFYDLGQTVTLLGTNLWHDENLLRSSGDYLVNAVFTDGFSAESKRQSETWFSNEFERLYNEAPSFIDAISFDSTYMVLKAATQTGSDTRAGVRNNLMRMQMKESITGFVGFDMNGNAQRNLNLLTVKNGRFINIGTSR